MPRQSLVKFISHEGAILEWSVANCDPWPETFNLKRDVLEQMIREAVESQENHVSFLCFRPETQEVTFDFFKIMRGGHYGMETCPVYIERIA